MSSNPRGRPIGSGTDDSAPLKRVAALLAEQPARRPRNAIVAVVGRRDDAAIRRLQRKWRTQGPALLAAARDARTPAPHFSSDDLVSRARALQPFGNLIDRASRQAIAIQRARDYLDPPALRLARDYANLSSVRMAHDYAMLASARVAIDRAQTAAQLAAAYAATPNIAEAIFGAQRAIDQLRRAHLL